VNTTDTARFWLDTLLHSYSQVLFQSQRFCGLLIVLAIALDGTTALLGSLLGWAGALLGARLIRADAALVRAGYYGFNGVLVGLALSHFLGGSWFSASGILVFSALSAPLIHLQIRRWSLPPYTSAFVLLSWCAWLLATGFDLLPAAAAATIPAAAETGLPDWLAGPIHGLGQVFFLGSVPAGLLILAALAVSAPRNAACWLICLASSLYRNAQPESAGR
jgi:urea transporter